MEILDLIDDLSVWFYEGEENPLLHKEIYVTPSIPSTAIHNYIVWKILCG